MHGGGPYWCKHMVISYCCLSLLFKNCKSSLQNVTNFCYRSNPVLHARTTINLIVSKAGSGQRLLAAININKHKILGTGTKWNQLPMNLLADSFARLGKDLSQLLLGSLKHILQPFEDLSRFTTKHKQAGSRSKQKMRGLFCNGSGFSFLSLVMAWTSVHCFACNAFQIKQHCDTVHCPWPSTTSVTPPCFYIVLAIECWANCSSSSL